MPPLGFEEPGRGDDRLVVDLREDWSEESLSASSFASRQKDFLKSSLDEFEILMEGVHDLAGGETAYFLDFEHEREDSLTLREKRIYFSRGPQIVTLALSGPAERGDREAILGGIEKSFSLRGGEFLEQAKHRPLLNRFDESLPFRDAQVHRFPQAGIAVPVPHGVSVASEKEGAFLRRDAMEIRFRRVLEHAPDSRLWFGNCMGRLREAPGCQLSGWGRGSLPDGRAYSGILWEERASSHSWVKAAATRELGVAIPGPFLLEAALRAPVTTHVDFETAFHSILQGLEYLNSSEWEVHPSEPWIDLTLHGAWKAEGPGSYLLSSSEGLTILQLSRSVSQSSLENLQPHLVGGVRRSSRVRDEAVERGTLHGLEALQYNGSGPVAVRALWVQAGGHLYSCLLQTPPASKLQADLPSRLLRGLRLPGMAAVSMSGP